MSASSTTSSGASRGSRPARTGKPIAVRASVTNSGSRPTSSAAAARETSGPGLPSRCSIPPKASAPRSLGVADLGRAVPARLQARDEPGLRGDLGRPGAAEAREQAVADPRPERLRRDPRPARDLVLGQRVHVPQHDDGGALAGPRRPAGNAARCLGRGELVANSGDDGAWQAARAAHSPAFCRVQVRPEVLPCTDPVKRVGGSWSARRTRLPACGAGPCPPGWASRPRDAPGWPARHAERRAAPSRSAAISRVSPASASSIGADALRQAGLDAADGVVARGRRHRAEPAVELVDAVLDRVEALRHRPDAAREPLEVGGRRQVERAERDGLGLGGLLARLEDATDRRGDELALEQLARELAERVLTRPRDAIAQPLVLALVDVLVDALIVVIGHSSAGYPAKASPRHI